MSLTVHSGRVRARIATLSPSVTPMSRRPSDSGVIQSHSWRYVRLVHAASSSDPSTRCDFGSFQRSASLPG